MSNFTQILLEILVILWFLQSYTVCISENSTKLREHLIDDLDYTLVPAEGWNKLLAWYGMVEEQVRHLYVCAREWVSSRTTDFYCYIMFCVCFNLPV